MSPDVVSAGHLGIVTSDRERTGTHIPGHRAYLVSHTRARLAAVVDGTEIAERR